MMMHLTSSRRNNDNSCSEVTALTTTTGKQQLLQGDDEIAKPELLSPSQVHGGPLVEKDPQQDSIRQHPKEEFVPESSSDFSPSSPSCVAAQAASMVLLTDETREKITKSASFELPCYVRKEHKEEALVQDSHAGDTDPAAVAASTSTVTRTRRLLKEKPTKKTAASSLELPNHVRTSCSRNQQEKLLLLQDSLKGQHTATTSTTRRRLFPKDHPVRPLKSALKPSSFRTNKKVSKPSTTTTARRVRGLWNPHCQCLFSQLHEDLLIHIMSFINVQDTLEASQVCRRWNHACRNEPSLWNHVDATEYICQNEHADIVTAALQKQLSRFPSSLKSLTIKDIQHRIDPNSWLPSVSILPNLQELCLTGFANLTDTHVHVMLMANRTSGYSITSNNNNTTIKKLSLEQCPLLTNKSVEYIAHHCGGMLKDLSLYGNVGITDISPLKNCWRKQQEIRTNESLQSQEPPLVRNSPLQSLFFVPPPPSQQVRNAPPIRERGGKLVSINIRRTGITADALCDSLLFQEDGLNNNNKVALQHLHASGDSWTNLDLQKFLDRINVKVLQTLDIGCCCFSGCSPLTNVAEALPAHYLKCLRHVNLSGHAYLTGKDVASLLQAAPCMEKLILNGCKGIIKEQECDEDDAFSTTLAHYGGNLQHVSLWRVFSQSRVQDNTIITGQALIIRALCSCRELQHVDLEGCLFFSLQDMELLLQHCPRLTPAKIIRRGTKCAKQQEEKSKGALNTLT